ncbi:fungal-specific transcription factor domain-containing protein, partial [Lasiosphaeria miniovina]
CNRIFPCNHCLKRGVAHLCRFVSKSPGSRTNREEITAGGESKSSKKRSLDSSGNDISSDETPYNEVEQSEIDVSDALNALGYLSHTHHLVLGTGHGPKVVNEPTDELAQSDELRAAKESMLAKPYTADFLVDNWLSGANYHYYSLYPPEFRTQYDGWWAMPSNHTTPELTALILRVCACSALYIIDNNVKQRLETELKVDAVTLARRLHGEAEKLSTSIPPGKGGLVQVQQLFLTAFWFKSAEKWTEAWHALGTAIREANEIGLHRDSFSEGMSEFDREMRRRLWGVLYMWDFALGSMLGRPLLVNHADCTFVMPTLALEIDPAEPYQPSPFRHMNLHCRLCLDMAGQLGSPSNPDTGETELAMRLRDVVDKWFQALPVEYALEAPDTRWDAEHPFVVFQRRYLHLIGFMSLFGSIKKFVTQNSAKPFSDIEMRLRARGVQAALGLMDVSWSFYETLASVGAKFHYAVFCIFDTTTVLCSAFVHDEARNLPQRETVLKAIRKGMAMLEELRSSSKTTAGLWCILKGLLLALPLSAKEKGLIRAPKRHKPTRR